MFSFLLLIASLMACWYSLRRQHCFAGRPSRGPTFSLVPWCWADTVANSAGRSSQLLLYMMSPLWNSRTQDTRSSWSYWMVVVWLSQSPSLQEYGQATEPHVPLRNCWGTWWVSQHHPQREHVQVVCLCSHGSFNTCSKIKKILYKHTLVPVPL